MRNENLMLTVNVIVGSKLSYNVSQLHEVWEKESLNFRLKTELSDTKPASELA